MTTKPLRSTGMWARYCLALCKLKKKNTDTVKDRVFHARTLSLLLIPISFLGGQAAGGMSEQRGLLSTGRPRGCQRGSTPPKPWEHVHWHPGSRSTDTLGAGPSQSSRAVLTVPPGVLCCLSPSPQRQWISPGHGQVGPRAAAGRAWLSSLRAPLGRELNRRGDTHEMRLWCVKEGMAAGKNQRCASVLLPCLVLVSSSCSVDTRYGKKHQFRTTSNWC